MEYDDKMAKVSRQAEEQKLVASAGLWARRVNETRECMFQLAEKLTAKAEAMLAFPLAETVSKDGLTTVKPAKWSFSDAARMVEVAQRLKQLSTGLPTDRHEHAGPEGTPFPAVTPSVVFYIPENGRDDASGGSAS